MNIKCITGRTYKEIGLTVGGIPIGVEGFVMVDAFYNEHITNMNYGNNYISEIVVEDIDGKYKFILRDIRFLEMQKITDDIFIWDYQARYIDRS